LRVLRAWHVEINAVLVVFLGRCRYVEVRERNLLRMLRIEVPQGLADDGVIVYLLLVLVTENQHRGRCGFVEFLVLASRRPRRRPRVEILITLLSRLQKI
jgi:hypothetical protein